MTAPRILGPDTSIKTILAATDLSARGDRSLARAALIARQHGAKLHALHVVDDQLSDAIQAQVKADARADLDKAVAALAGDEPLDVAADVVAGRGYNEILARADRCGADLIVMGTHRNETFRNPFVGTGLERVIRYGAQPVLVVPKRVDGAYRKVVVGVDFSAFSRVAIRGALALAPAAQVHAVHAYHQPFGGFLGGEHDKRTVRTEHEDALAKFIEAEMTALVETCVSGADTRPNIALHVETGQPIAVLRRAVTELKPDLVTLGTHGRVGVANAILGSVAESLLNDPPCDVLVVKAW